VSTPVVKYEFIRSLTPPASAITLESDRYSVTYRVGGSYVHAMFRMTIRPLPAAANYGISQKAATPKLHVAIDTLVGTPTMTCAIATATMGFAPRGRRAGRACFPCPT
jgi:acetoacetate decarboxylase